MKLHALQAMKKHTLLTVMKMRYLYTHTHTHTSGAWLTGDNTHQNIRLSGGRDFMSLSLVLYNMFVLNLV
jgi:hypothetical protein